MQKQRKEKAERKKKKKEREEEEEEGMATHTGCARQIQAACDRVAARPRSHRDPGRARLFLGFFFFFFFFLSSLMNALWFSGFLLCFWVFFSSGFLLCFWVFFSCCPCSFFVCFRFKCKSSLRDSISM